MSAHPRHYYTLDEYFALEHASDARFEYWDGDIICMSGGSQQHSTISGNVHYRLRIQLEGRNCRAFTADQAVKTPTFPPYRYPDATVVCGKAKFETIRGIDTLVNPILIVEVMSPTSQERDCHDKFAMYQDILSFKEYLVIAQDAPLVIQHIKQPDGSWVTTEASELTASVALSSVEGVLTLKDIYQDVQFEDE